MNKNIWGVLACRGKGWLKDMSRMIFPLTCEVCGTALVEGERVLCLGCMAAMPGVDCDPDSDLARRLSATVMVEKVAAMFAYRRDTSYARVLQKSKYNHRPDIDYDLAREFAARLLPKGFFNDIDVVLAVPMHYMKKLRRGFNQAEEIARGVAETAGLEIMDNLVAVRPHKTQTRRNIAGRLKNAEGVYAVVYPDELRGKHVLLVDDIITTGATLMSCCDALRDAVPDLRICILTLAATRLA